MIPYIILFVIGIVWAAVSVMSSKFYATGKENRFRFRYWFAIGMLNIFHVLLAFLYKATGDGSFQEARWLAFVLIDALLLEVFIIPVIRRKQELFIRIGFYFCLILDFMGSSPFFIIINAIILMYLALHSKFKMIKAHFFTSFVLYGLMSSVPYFVGFTTNWSLFVGMLYSTHMAVGVFRLYSEERSDEIIKEKMREEKDKE